MTAKNLSFSLIHSCLVSAYFKLQVNPLYLFEYTDNYYLLGTVIVIFPQTNILMVFCSMQEVRSFKYFLQTAHLTQIAICYITLTSSAKSRVFKS